MKNLIILTPESKILPPLKNSRSPYIKKTTKEIKVSPLLKCSFEAKNFEFSPSKVPISKKTSSNLLRGSSFNLTNSPVKSKIEFKLVNSLAKEKALKSLKSINNINNFKR